MEGPFIFLDIDGVLNSDTYFRWKASKRPNKEVETDMVDIRKVRLLKQIVDASNAKIIVSSSWRGPLKAYIENRHAGDRLNSGWLRKPVAIFNKVGIEFAGYTDKIWHNEWYGKENGKSADGYMTYTFDDKYAGAIWGRSYEIMDYIKENNLKGHFIILDDDCWDLLPFVWNGPMINTTWKHGLTPKHVPLALDILKNGLTCEEWLERWPLFDPDYKGELPKIDVVKKEVEVKGHAVFA